MRTFCSLQGRRGSGPTVVAGGWTMDVCKVAPTPLTESVESLLGIRQQLLQIQRQLQDLHAPALDDEVLYAQVESLSRVAHNLQTELDAAADGGTEPSSTVRQGYLTQLHALTKQLQALQDAHSVRSPTSITGSLQRMLSGWLTNSEDDDSSSPPIPRSSSAGAASTCERVRHDAMAGAGCSFVDEMFGLPVGEDCTQQQPVEQSVVRCTGSGRRGGSRKSGPGPSDESLVSFGSRMLRAISSGGFHDKDKGE